MVRDKLIRLDLTMETGVLILSPLGQRCFLLLFLSNWFFSVSVFLSLRRKRTNIFPSTTKRRYSFGKCICNIRLCKICEQAPSRKGRTGSETRTALTQPREIRRNLRKGKGRCNTSMSCILFVFCRNFIIQETAITGNLNYELSFVDSTVDEDKPGFYVFCSWMFRRY